MTAVPAGVWAVTCIVAVPMGKPEAGATVGGVVVAVLVGRVLVGRVLVGRVLVGRVLVGRVLVGSVFVALVGRLPAEVVAAGVRAVVVTFEGAVVVPAVVVVADVAACLPGDDVRTSAYAAAPISTSRATRTATCRLR